MRSFFRRAVGVATRNHFAVAAATGSAAAAAAWAQPAQCARKVIQHEDSPGWLSNTGPKVVEIEETYLVLAAPGMEENAERIVASDPSKFKRIEVSWNRFPDNTDNIKVEGFEGGINHLRSANVLFLANFTSNDTTLSQYHVMVMVLESFIKELTVLPPHHLHTHTCTTFTESLGYWAHARAGTDLYTHALLSPCRWCSHSFPLAPWSV